MDEDVSTGGIPRAMLQSWPDRWLYPDLAAALAETDQMDGIEAETAPGRDPHSRHTHAEMAELLLHGLAAPHTPAATADRLIADLNFAAAEQLLEEAAHSSSDLHLPAAEIARLQRKLAKTRTQQAALRTRTLATLRSRALRARSIRADHGMGGGSTASVEPVNRLLFSADNEIGGDLRAIEAAVDDLQASTAKYLYNELARRAAELPGNPDTDAWADRTRTLIEARAFPAARDLLNSGPQAADALGHGAIPATLPHLPGPWPWPGDAFGRIIDNFHRTPPPPWPGFSTWIPPDDDTTAWSLLDAARALTDEVTVPSAIRFAAALDRALSAATRPDDADPATDEAEVPSDDGAWVITAAVECEPAAALTQLRSPFDLWIGANPPPARDPGHHKPVLWFVPSTNSTGAAPEAVARLDGSFLIRLLAPAPDSRTSSSLEIRRIHFIRAVASRFSLAVLLGTETEPARDLIRTPSGMVSRDELAWLLFLLGFTVNDESVLDLVHYDTAGHPEVVRALLKTATAEAIPSAVRRHRLTRDALDRIRVSPAYLELAVAGLLRDLADDVVARRALRVAAATYVEPLDATFTPQDLTDWFGLLGEETEPDPVRTGEITEALAEHGLFARCEGGGYRLPESGLRILLYQWATIR